MIDRLKCGDLVVIRDPDVVESFIHANPDTNGDLYGIVIELYEPDSDGNMEDDVWAVLVNDSAFLMLRREFCHVRA